ncbi:Ankyrin repeats-containing protein [Cardinium endosymbiont cBtQ1 of Bemisia tabaci]|uniref:hypothetical protein n=1 Tax=Cardinium endosymbiont of Bemisia tabaci TaxID=672794 RepID=UPI000442D1FE|nr:hypothetical protein [Cardinium endosymbiont of Bemisia tabaci]CDG49823.1 Ankyrin repeats-containing protein [Cardinium endosymbiont cBtQ1 of Bemisia tabaci]
MHKPFSFTLSIYIACSLLGACSKLGSRYGIIENIDQEHRNNIENLNENIENPDAPLSDSVKKLFKAIRDSNLAEVGSLLNNHFNGEAFMDLCETNKHGNTCLHVAAGQNDSSKSREAEEIIKLLLGKMLPLLATKKVLKQAFDRIGPMKLWCLESPSTSNNDNNKILSKILEIDNTLKNIALQRCNSDSELIRKNHKDETPICVAIKKGSSEVMNTLLICTNKFIEMHRNAQRDEQGLTNREDNEDNNENQSLIDKHTLLLMTLINNPPPAKGNHDNNSSWFLDRESLVDSLSYHLALLDSGSDAPLDSGLGTGSDAPSGSAFDAPLDSGLGTGSDAPLSAHPSSNSGLHITYKKSLKPESYIQFSASDAPSGSHSSSGSGPA